MSVLAEKHGPAKESCKWIRPRCDCRIDRCEMRHGEGRACSSDRPPTGGSSPPPVADVPVIWATGQTEQASKTPICQRSWATISYNTHSFRNLHRREWNTGHACCKIRVAHRHA